MRIRGLLSLFTKELYGQEHRTGIFVATAEPELVKLILQEVQDRFTQVSFTYVAPRACSPSLFAGKKTVWFEEIKNRPIAWTLRLRHEKFDICVVIMGGGPPFRKAKLWSFFLNTRRTLVYNENLDSYVIDRTHWKLIYDHFAWRRKTGQFAFGRIISQPLFFPFGLMYLVGRTAWLTMRARTAPKMWRTEKATGNHAKLDR